MEKIYFGINAVMTELVEDPVPFYFQVTLCANKTIREEIGRKLYKIWERLHEKFEKLWKLEKLWKYEKNKGTRKIHVYKLLGAEYPSWSKKSLV